MLFKIIFLVSITLFSVETRNNQVKVIRPPTCNIKRPCPNLDIKCIQKEFIKRNWFDDNVGNQPDGPLIIKETITYPIPFTKISTYVKDTVVTGLDKGKVTEFYINEDTDKAVLSCRYCNIKIKSSMVMDIYRAGQESIQFLAPKLQEEYSDIRSTTIITGLNGPPDMATHFDKLQAKKMDFGKGMEKIKDKDVKKIFKQLEQNADLLLKEAFLPVATIFQDYFVNNVIGKGIPPPEEEAPPAVPPAAYAFASAMAGAF